MTKARNIAEFADDLSVSNGEVSIADLKPSQSMMFRNKIINGDMRIAQRGTSFTSSGVTYGLDRFAHYSGSPVSNNIEQSTDVPSNQGFDYSIKLNNVDLRHSVELPAAGKQGVFASGKVFTLSFWGKTGSSTKSTTINLVFNNGSAYTDSTSPFTSTNNTVTLTTTWQRFEIQYTIDQAATGNHIACTFSIDANAYINYFTGFQLEEGTVATPFEHRPYGLELSLCQRYYAFFRAGGGMYWSNGNAVTTASYPVEMRDTPQSVTVKSVITDYPVSSTWTAARITKLGFEIIRSSSTSYNYVVADWAANAEL